MENKRTGLVFICDRSGSMCGLESDTIGGYNSMLKKQKELTGDCRVTTVLFDDQYELLHDRLDIQAVRPMTDKEYYVRGCTALLDAIGKTIQKIAAVQRHSAPEMRAEKVLFVIITDGMENASREYTAAQIKNMVKKEQTKYGWEFIFLGANIDAIETAGGMGIAPERAVNYHADAKGTQLNYEAISHVATCVRTGCPVTADWKEAIDQDFASRDW